MSERESRGTRVHLRRLKASLMVSMPSSPSASSRAHSIQRFSMEYDDTPTYSALSCATALARAPMVSCSGVSGSRRWEHKMSTWRLILRAYAANRAQQKGYISKEAVVGLAATKGVSRPPSSRL